MLRWTDELLVRRHLEKEGDEASTSGLAAARRGRGSRRLSNQMHRDTRNTYAYPFLSVAKNGCCLLRRESGCFLHLP